MNKNRDDTLYGWFAGCIPDTLLNDADVLLYMAIIMNLYAALLVASS